MDKLSWETFNHYWLNYQQEFIAVTVLITLLLVVAGILIVKGKKPESTIPDESKTQQPQIEKAKQRDVSAEIASPGVSVNETAQKRHETPLTPVVREKSLTERFRVGLAKTGQHFSELFSGNKAIDNDLIEELETYLLMADVGVDVTGQVLEQLKQVVKTRELKSSDDLKLALQEILLEILRPCEKQFLQNANVPSIILVVGVNGVGKTTTIGKLTHFFQNQGKKVLLAAGDTFRAAAVEQLQQWGSRNNVPVIAQHTGADSASVIFDAIESARAKNMDMVIADTAGRLHNKSNLMEELEKIKRVAGKLDKSAPHEVILVLDAGTGQNALSQMHEFSQSVGVTGIILTKLDGTAKGGVVFPLCQKYGVPIQFVGLGEGVDDLQPFVAETFVKALFPVNNDSLSQ